jgi:pseudaminic acid synthase
MGRIKIGSHNIGQDYPPFIIAEMSGNHNTSLDRALSIVDSAADSGAHAIKLQTYTPETMTLDINHSEFVINNADSIWNGRSLYSLYEEAHTPWEWHIKIMERAKEKNILCFSTPFDESSVDFLESLEVPCYKISSFECTDLPLIKKVASTGKPMIISTGMASISDIAETVKVASSGGCKDIILLKCTSTYPASPDSTNLRTISNMREVFNCEVGISDHTNGIGVSLGSIAFGSTVIEKHFTLARSDGGVDSLFSLEPNELKDLSVESKSVWQALGGIHYGPTSSEKKSLIGRRSIYVSEDIKKGEVLTIKNIRRIRPGLGLEPKYFDIVIGRRVNISLKRGTPLSWEMLT